MWLDKQIEEKKQKKIEEKNDNQNYDTQVLELNKIRGMVHDDFEENKKEKIKNLKEYNIKLYEEKWEYEEKLKNQKLNEEKRELENILRRGEKQEFI